MLLLSSFGKSDGGTKTSSNGFREKSVDLMKFDPDSWTVQRTNASISLDVNQFRRGLLALGIPYICQRSRLNDCRT